MNREQRKTRIESLLALLLFGVFALCVLVVLLTGADAYKGLTERDRTNYDGRTAAQYLTTRVRQADALEGIRLESFAGLDALVVSEDIEGELYETRIYRYDGYIRELFAVAENDFVPEDGDKVLALESLTLSCQDGLLQAEITEPDGTVQHLTLSLRSGKEVCP